MDRRRPMGSSKQVRGGEAYTVMDRETPIARLVPYGAGCFCAWSWGSVTG